MGLKFYVSEAQARSLQASQLSNQANQAINSLQASIRLFLSAPLSSKAYDSAKSYFMVAYTPLCQSAIMTGEALDNAHKKFLSEYQSSVSSIDTDEDLILEEINQFEQLKQRLDHQMSTAKIPRPDLEHRYINACESIDKRQDKLEKFHAYNSQSASIFSEYEACQQEFNAGLMQVKDSQAWNPASGTFDLGKLNMSWAKPINDRWKIRQQALDSKRAAEIKAAKDMLDGYDIMRIKNGNGYEYTVLNGSKFLDPKKFPELYSALKTCGDSLPANRFTEVTIKKGIVDPSIAIPGFGGLGNIKNVVKGIGTVIVSAGTLAALNRAPSISFSDTNTDDVEIEIPKDIQRKIKKLSPEQKKALDNALDKLAKGDKTGLNDHILKGDRKGERAFDVRGKGTGNNRGGIRGIYERIGNGKIRLKDVFKGHKY